jgi:hypothetical protein
MERVVLVFTAPPFSLPPLRRRVYIDIGTIVLSDLPSLGAVSSCDGLAMAAVLGSRFGVGRVHCRKWR